jgi:hypothetical protein
MIDETLAQLQAKIRQASALNAAQQAELLQLLQALYTEIHVLAHTHTEQAESIARFTGVSTHEAVRQHRNPLLVEVALQGLVSRGLRDLPSPACAYCQRHQHVFGKSGDLMGVTNCPESGQSVRSERTIRRWDATAPT